MAASWLVMIGAAVVATALAMWLVLDLLLGEADQAGADQRPVARIEAIRTGLAVAAEAGALADLYIQAVEQLGSDRAPVRLGGLYALARLGQGNFDHRQTVVDVLCAYLRMPFDEDGPAGEIQVRRTAQRLLAKHLSIDNVETFLRDMDLELSGATLVGFHFYNCRARRGNFNHAIFTGRTAIFALADFAEGAQFSEAQFRTDVTFADATVHLAESVPPEAWRLEPATAPGKGVFVQDSVPVDGDRVANSSE